MKKILGLILVLVMATAIAAGCGKSSGGASGADISSVKTFGDLEKFETDGYTFSSTKFATVVIADGNYYRAEADLPEDVSAALDELSWEDPDHDKKLKEILAPLEIGKLTNLSEQIIPQEELDKLVGKTGQELLDDGWEAGGSTLDEHSMYMYNGAFQYNVTFEETIVETDEIFGDDAIKDLTVKSIGPAEISSNASDVD